MNYLHTARRLPWNTAYRNQGQAIQNSKLAKLSAKYGATPSEGKLARNLFELFDLEEPGENVIKLKQPVTQLFEDAGVPYHRTNRRGQTYNLVESSILEFIHWHNMPWK